MEYGPLPPPPLPPCDYSESIEWIEFLRFICKLEMHIEMRYEKKTRSDPLGKVINAHCSHHDCKAHATFLKTSKEYKLLEYDSDHNHPKGVKLQLIYTGTSTFFREYIKHFFLTGGAVVDARRVAFEDLGIPQHNQFSFYLYNQRSLTNYHSALQKKLFKFQITAQTITSILLI